MRNFSKTVIWYSVDCILAWTSNSSHLYHKQPMSSKLWLVKLNYICTAPLKSKVDSLGSKLETWLLERIKFQFSRNQHFWVFITWKDLFLEKDKKIAICTRAKIHTNRQRLTCTGTTEQTVVYLELWWIIASLYFYNNSILWTIRDVLSNVWRCVSF